MRLVKFKIKNFRGFKEQEIDFTNFTTVVGKNDAGKSTIFEALDIFFGNSKIDSGDKNISVNDSENNSIEFIAYFDHVPENMILETIPTSLTEEYLINHEEDEEFLTIKQVYNKSLNKKEYLVCDLPNSKNTAINGIHTLTIDDLKKKFPDVLEDVDKRKSTEIRKAILRNEFKKAAAMGGEKFKKVDVDLKKMSGDKSNSKDISRVIHSNLPLYQLFKADRSNDDSDSEVQDPVKAIVKTAIADDPSIQENLQDVNNKVNDAVSQITSATLKMLQEMDNSLAKDIQINFQPQKWDSLFKFSLDTESGIPLNKRGSGVRRLILLNFFRSEAKRKLKSKEITNQQEPEQTNIIYAFEEPETALHPSFQKKLIDSLEKMSESPNIQVLITTHSPAIAAMVPADSVRLVTKESSEGVITSGATAIEKTIEELGLIPNVKIYPDQIKRVVVVEGPTDVDFFSNMYHQLSKKSLSEQEKTVFISGGGAALIDLVNSKFINKLEVSKKIVILDGDEGGEDDKRRLTKNDFDSAKIITLKKATIEFYLPYEEIKALISTGHDEQNQFNVSKEEWESGDSDKKLGKAQKRILKKHRIGNIYSTTEFESLSSDNQVEIEEVVKKIDS